MASLNASLLVEYSELLWYGRQIIKKGKPGSE